MNRYDRITKTRTALRTESCSYLRVPMVLAIAAVPVDGTTEKIWYVDESDARYMNMQTVEVKECPIS